MAWLCVQLRIRLCLSHFLGLVPTLIACCLAGYPSTRSFALHLPPVCSEETQRQHCRCMNGPWPSGKRLAALTRQMLHTPLLTLRSFTWSR
jgi:hypothetical protein